MAVGRHFDRHQVQARQHVVVGPFGKQLHARPPPEGARRDHRVVQGATAADHEVAGDWVGDPQLTRAISAELEHASVDPPSPRLRVVHARCPSSDRDDGAQLRYARWSTGESVCAHHAVLHPGSFRCLQPPGAAGEAQRRWSQTGGPPGGRLPGVSEACGQVAAADLLPPDTEQDLGCMPGPSRSSSAWRVSATSTTWLSGTTEMPSMVASSHTALSASPARSHESLPSSDVTTTSSPSVGSIGQRRDVHARRDPRRRDRSGYAGGGCGPPPKAPGRIDHPVNRAVSDPRRSSIRTRRSWPWISIARSTRCSSRSRLPGSRTGTLSHRGSGHRRESYSARPGSART